jgi:hypothetical protein
VRRGGAVLCAIALALAGLVLLLVSKTPTKVVLANNQIGQWNSAANYLDRKLMTWFNWIELRKFIDELGLMSQLIERKLVINAPVNYGQNIFRVTFVERHNCRINVGLCQGDGYIRRGVFSGEQGKEPAWIDGRFAHLFAKRRLLVQRLVKHAIRAERHGEHLWTNVYPSRNRVSNILNGNTQIQTGAPIWIESQPRAVQPYSYSYPGALTDNQGIVSRVSGVLGSISGFLCGTRLPRVHKEDSKRNNYSRFFPRWGALVAPVGVIVLLWGWNCIRNERRLFWGILAFIGGAILWGYGYISLFYPS